MGEYIKLAEDTVMTSQEIIEDAGENYTLDCEWVLASDVEKAFDKVDSDVDDIKNLLENIKGLTEIDEIKELIEELSKKVYFY